MIVDDRKLNEGLSELSEGVAMLYESQLREDPSWQHVARGHVVLWSTRLEHVDPLLVSFFRMSLSEAERGKADRLHFERDRMLYTTAHALLYAMLSRYSTDISGFQFRTNQWGKPEVDSPGNKMRFSLTHTSGLAACAITLVDDLGVDAEVWHHALDPVELANQFFAPSEAAHISSLPELDRGLAFFQLWTLKEAFVKAVGKGLSVPLADFEFTLDPFTFACSRVGYDARKWHFKSFSLASTYSLAVALHRPTGGEMIVQHTTLSAHELATELDPIRGTTGVGFKV